MVGCQRKPHTVYAWQSRGPSLAYGAQHIVCVGGLPPPSSHPVCATTSIAMHFNHSRISQQRPYARVSRFLAPTCDQD
jgi:hypothetical protein